ncbi:MAG: hypothetical protein IKS28_01570, partial [Clostridia bacterium]|nr:hypothetical protein [Clostridia bacterium]
MKRLITFFTAIALALSFALNFSSQSADCITTITGDNVVTAGYEFLFTFTAKVVNIDDGIVGGNFVIKYDAECLDLVEVTFDSIDKWNMDEKHSSAGTIELNPADEKGGLDEASVKVRNGESIKYYFKFRVKESTWESTIIKVDEAMVQSAENGNYQWNYIVEMGSHTIKLAKSLATPEIISFDNGVAKWSPVEHADKYVLQIYKG